MQGSVRCALLACLAAALPDVAAAATCTWTGAGTAITWSTAANWDNCGGTHATPQNGDRLVFAVGGAAASSINDLSGLSVGAVVIGGVPVSGSRYVIWGNGIVLTGDLEFAAPADIGGLGPVFSVPLTLGSASTFRNSGTGDGHLETVDLAGFPLVFASEAGDIIVAGAIAGAGPVTKNGSRTLVLQWPSTFTGATRIDAGSVRIENPNALGNAAAGTTVEPGARLVGQAPFSSGNEPITLNGGTIAVLGGLPLPTGDGWRYATIAQVTLTADSAIDVGDVVAFGITEIQGGYTLAKSGDGVLRVDAPNPAFTGRIVMDAGELWLRDYFGYHGSLENADVIAPGGNVSGCGRAGAVSVSNGWLWPCWPRPLETADLSLGSGAKLLVDMLPELGAQFYGRLRVTGTVTLENPKLQPSVSDSLGTALVMGAVFTIIENDGTDPVVGTFAGLPEGAIVTDFGLKSFVVSYVGGDGNDVTLTRSPSAPYMLSEGATGPFFDEDILIVNPNEAAPVSLTFVTRDGNAVVQNRVLPARSRTTIHVDEIPGLEGTEVSTAVRSTADLPLAVERTMFWDRTHYAGHTASSVQPSREWLFAEGSQGFFHTYLMLGNVAGTATDVTLTFLREGGPPVVRNILVAPSTRLTIDCGAIPDLVNTSFGITVHSSQPIVAERAMYFGTMPGRVFSGGHGAAGVTTPAGSWFFAEGATGDFFDTFLLLSNPQSTDAAVTLRYLLGSGEVATSMKIVPAMARLTVNLEAEGDPRLRHAAVSTLVTADAPIVAERSMYWIGDVAPWAEGHNSFGVMEGGVEWLLAEGRVGGPQNFHTYILLANLEGRVADVRVEFIREGDFPIVRDYRIPASSRFNIDVNAVSPDLQNASVATHVTVYSGNRIVVERSMYWDSGGQFFKGGTNAIGVRVR